ncbi:flavoprotein [Rubrobacter radiotolerans]|uniref:Flavoprotein n=1 Tax=Rubrobacter radiotolerans TaxID=42256 RepID=A0AB35TA50_RUBRA|nr:flavoprotein [Rubrobacter radiotolerans]MDX5895308.1 flavoprotein [Rubrobacter radiotolerans]SMC01615.1 Flavoprotein [Rubrobacter radiotolerans DSM 5868]
MLVGVSGSIAVVNLISYLTIFRDRLTREIKVIMTDAAASMLPPSTVALFCDGVFLDKRSSPERRPGHVDLARWCDLFVVLPATANVLGLTAHGVAPNLLTNAVLASPRPVVFCPNMNDVMWRKKVVQRNIELLREEGHVVVEPILASAYEATSGETRRSWVLPDPNQLVDHLREAHSHLRSLDSSAE